MPPFYLLHRKSHAPHAIPAYLAWRGDGLSDPGLSQSLPWSRVRGWSRGLERPLRTGIFVATRRSLRGEMEGSWSVNRRGNPQIEYLTKVIGHCGPASPTCQGPELPLLDLRRWFLRYFGTLLHKPFSENGVSECGQILRIRPREGHNDWHQQRSELGKEVSWMVHVCNYGSHEPQGELLFRIRVTRNVSDGYETEGAYSLNTRAGSVPEAQSCGHPT